MIANIKSLKRALQLSVPALALLVAPLANAQGPVENTIEVEFGYLYGGYINSYPTTVLSGTGPLGEAMAGNTFYWVCLDQTTASPDTAPSTYTFTVSADTTILSAGDMWGSHIDDPVARESIGVAITNMFFAFKANLLQPLDENDNSVGYAFQEAVWALTTGYSLEYWSGTVDETAVNNILENYSVGMEPMFEDFIRASLVSAGGRQQVFFANPNPAEQDADGGMNTIQTIAFFTDGPIPIPEPSSVLLLSGAGALVLLRRFRSRSTGK